jgi:hypothetical protein
MYKYLHLLTYLIYDIQFPLFSFPLGNFSVNLFQKEII